MNGFPGILCSLDTTQLILNDEFVVFACHHILNSENSEKVNEIYFTNEYSCKFFLDLMARGIDLSPKNNNIQHKLAKLDIFNEVKFCMNSEMVRLAVENLIMIMNKEETGNDLTSQELADMLSNILESQ